MADVRFTPDEIKQLVESGEMTEKDMGLLHPADQAVAADAMVKSGRMQMMGAPLLPPGLTQAAAGLTSGVTSLISQSLKGLLQMPSGMGGALKAGVGGYLGWEGAQAAGQALNLPAPLRNILALAGAHLGGGFGKGANPAAAEEGAMGGAKVTSRPPMSDAEFESAMGRPRFGAKTANGLAPKSPAPSPRPDGGLPTTVKPGDYPPNVSTTRNSGDVREQVTGSSRRGYEDTYHSYDNRDYPLDEPNGKLMDDLKATLNKRQGVGLRPPSGSSKQAKFHEADQGAKELEELLNATGRLDPLNGASHGTLPAEPRAKRRKPQ